MDSADQQGETSRRFINVIQRSADVVGATVASAANAAITNLLPGPEGAALGGAISTAASTMFQSIGHEISSRWMAPREQARVGGVFGLAAMEIVQRCEGGEQFRDDGFFDLGDTGRSDAEEVWESILVKAQREPEEKKLPYMAHLLANVAFNSRINAAMAHQMTKAAEVMTYRQLCILRLTAAKERFNLRSQSFRESTPLYVDLYQLVYEYYDLTSRGLINNGETLAVALVDVNPGAATLQALGQDLYQQMALHLIPDEDLSDLVAHLQ